MQAELDARLEARLREMDEAYNLSPLQEKKLRLAARGEFRRIFDDVDQMQGRFESAQVTANQAIRFDQEMMSVRNDLFADPLGDASFLEKVLTKTLVGAQVARHQERLRERALSEYRGWIDVLITHETQGLGLSNEQRRGLAELLRDVAEPERRRGRPSYDEVILRLAAVPEAKMKAVLDDDQWQAIRKRTEPVKAKKTTGREAGALP